MTNPDPIQSRALETYQPPDGDPLVQIILGLVGEAGVLAKEYKKHLYKPGYSTTRTEIVKRLGGLLWYVAVGAHEMGLTLDQLSREGYKELTGAYPEE
jgi:hypothetical protein